VGLLASLMMLPLAGAALIAFLPAGGTATLRRIALAATLATLAYAAWLLTRFDPAQAGFQFAETHVWNPRVGTSFALGVDGISLPMVLLTALLSLVAVLASGAIERGARLYFSILLVLEATVLGVFMARDWALFYVFWELTLIPLFFLIDRLGGENRHRAALNFVLYTMGGSVFMLIALLLLYDAAPAHSFAMGAIAEGARTLPERTQFWIFMGLLIGFGVKMPIFPLHGWLPLAHVEAPSPVSILLSGILLKMGSYGLIRAADTLPAAIVASADWLAALACVNMVYGGVLAWRSRDLKAMVAYSSISHMGVVLLGLAALNVAGLTGAVMQMVAHGLVAGAMFMMVGLLYERSHTRDIADYGSLVETMPRAAFFVVLGFVAAIGLPGSAGFVAELNALVGGYARWGGWMVVLSLSVLLSAAYGIRTINRLTTGAPSAAMLGLPDMRRGEVAAAALLGVGTLVLGLVPGPFLGLIASSVGALAAHWGG
jgi:NADH-quinone oxidoreductase subunit M